jgi:protein-disulfide isomerase
MRCEDVENDITQYLAGQLPAESMLLEHLAECGRCRQQVEELRSTWDGLDRLAVPKSSPVMNADLLAALAAIEDKIPEIPERRRPMLYFAKPALITFLALSAAFFVGRSFVESSRETSPAGTPAVNAGQGHYRGASGAPVTLLEYGDYQCPPCGSYNPVINEVLKRYDGKVRLEFRHFPLSRHANAALAAMAAEAAGQQGRYWEMHDRLFDSLQQWSQSSNSETDFLSLAANLGLDQAQFVRDLHSPELQQRIAADIATAKAAHVAATPTFFLNGHHVEDNIPPNTDVFAKLIDAELQNAK